MNCRLSLSSCKLTMKRSTDRVSITVWCKREKLKRNLVRAPKCGISLFKNAKCDEWKQT